jgi:ATP/maltotriose-dependent transcriptional regulator MalT
MTDFTLEADNLGITSFVDTQQLLTMKMQPHFLADNYFPPQSILSQIGQVPETELLLLNAAPGYGKSSFSAYWQKQSNKKWVWLTLGDTENNSLRLLQYLIGALSQAEPYGWPKVEQILQQKLHNWMPLLQRLTLDNDGFAFVIDGLHHITDQRSLKLLWEWIEVTLKCGKIHYCVTSRQLIEVPSTLRLDHKILQLDADALALSSTDVQRMVTAQSTSKHGLLQGTRWELAAVSEGHPVIIKLWLQDSGYKHWTQVLTPKGLLTSSVSQWFKDLNCESLASLERQGWIQAGTIHQVARAWMTVLGVALPADTGCLPEVVQIENALASQQPRVAILKIEEHIDQLISYADHQRYLTWMDTLGDEHVKKSPWALAFFSWIAGQAGWLDRAEHLMAAAPFMRDTPALSHLWLTLRAFIARAKGETINAIKLCNDCLSLQESLPSVAVYNAIALGNAYMAEYRVLEAEQAFATALSLSQSAERPELQALALYYRARLTQCQGQLRSTSRFLAAAEALLADMPYRAPVLEGRIGMYRGYLHWLQGHHEQAERVLQKSLLLSSQTQDPYALQGFVVVAALYRSRGELDSSRFVLDRVEALLQQWKVSNVIYKYWLQGMKALLLLDENKLSLAKPTLDNLYQLSKHKDGIPTPECFPQLAGFLELSYARLKANLGRLKESMKILDYWVERFETTGLGFNQVLVKTLRAQLRYQLGLRDLAITDLKQALATAEKEFCAMPFVELGEEAVHLAKQLVPNQRWEEMLDVLVGKAKADMEKRSEETKTCAISNRELRVLKLMAEGMSNQEIAESLYISLNTVKTHARRINTKLSVKNRTQAILKAQKLALL